MLRHGFGGDAENLPDLFVGRLALPFEQDDFPLPRRQRIDRTLKNRRELASGDPLIGVGWY